MISTVMMAGLVVMKGRGVMEVFSPSARVAWKEYWQIRLLAIGSLALQIVLILLGRHRRHVTGRWIRVIVWCAYLGADSVATIALGVLSSDLGDIYKGGGEVDRNSLLTAFWAPFFLLHLGGPDTITAYSIEDNDLYLRHLLGLLAQTVVAGYVSLMAWKASRLSYLTILLTVAGMIKYGERTWSLWQASTGKLQESVLTLMNIRKTSEDVRDKIRDLEAKIDRAPAAGGNIIKAYEMFEQSKRLFADLTLSSHEQEESQLLWEKIDVKDAFDMIAVELGFVYDLLYTKATVIYSAWGLFRRIVTVALTCTVLVIFCYDEYLHKYKKVDMIITFLLLGGAFLLEIYAFLPLIFSDQAIHWCVLKHPKFAQAAVSAISSHLSSSEPFKVLPRWSGTMGQLDLLSLFLKENPSLFNRWRWGHKLGLNFKKKRGGLGKLEMYRYRKEKKFEESLQKQIFRHVREKYDGLKSKESGTTQEIKFRGFCSQRGRRAVDNNSNNMNPYLYDKIRESVEQFEFDQSMLIWHIATEICSDKDGSVVSHHQDIIKADLEIGQCISRYMMYLLAFYPSMLPVGIGLVRLLETRSHADEHFENVLPGFSSKSRGKSSYSKQILRGAACSLLLKRYTKPPERRYSALHDAQRLASGLQEIDDKAAKWRLIRDVWVEMLTYAANHCQGRQHAHQLRRGGELLTHVWLLLAHFGLLELFLTTNTSPFLTEYQHHTY